jgi:uncharacterized protein YjaG (DUF416 family)
LFFKEQRPFFMQIISIEYPNIHLQLETSEKLSLNFEAFVNRIAPDQSNPYRKILEANIFVKAYVKDDKLIWDEVLELLMCGGDTMMMPAEFSEKELITFAKL